MLTPVSGLRVCTYVCAHAFYVCQCRSSASHRHAIVEVQRAVSLLPHTGQRMQLQSDSHPSSHLTHVEWILHKPTSSVLPSGGPITVVGLQLLLHLRTPHLNTQRGTHACIHSHTHTHMHTNTGIPQTPCWESGEWVDHTNILSPSSPSQMSPALFAWTTMI